MSAVEIPRRRRASARSRPSFRRTWRAGRGSSAAVGIRITSAMSVKESTSVRYNGRSSHPQGATANVSRRISAGRAGDGHRPCPGNDEAAKIRPAPGGESVLPVAHSQAVPVERAAAASTLTGFGPRGFTANCSPTSSLLTRTKGVISTGENWMGETTSMGENGEPIVGHNSHAEGSQFCPSYPATRSLLQLLAGTPVYQSKSGREVHFLRRGRHRFGLTF
jgi:hypothetical protein